ncbi:hypothetical protein [Thiolapillus sp.]|uniref:hypothetical protein n=1 Tax=Thiolapillus sp. TaxID=2017437 RepID=UPI002600F733|nr:hypothetical protein [Thiolapillus sp.]
MFSLWRDACRENTADGSVIYVSARPMGGEGIRITRPYSIFPAKKKPRPLARSGLLE